MAVNEVGMAVEMSDDGNDISVAFGPVPVEKFWQFLTFLGTEAGQSHVLNSILAAQLGDAAAEVITDVVDAVKAFL